MPSKPRLPAGNAKRAAAQMIEDPAADFLGRPLDLVQIAVRKVVGSNHCPLGLVEPLEKNVALLGSACWPSPPM